MEDSDDAELQRLWFATKQLPVARRPVTAAEASTIQSHHGTYQDNKDREDGDRGWGLVGLRRGAGGTPGRG